MLFDLAFQMNWKYFLVCVIFSQKMAHIFILSALLFLKPWHDIKHTLFNTFVIYWCLLSFFQFIFKYHRFVDISFKLLTFPKEHRFVDISFKLLTFPKDTPILIWKKRFTLYTISSLNLKKIPYILYKVFFLKFRWGVPLCDRGEIDYRTDLLYTN